jgi:hypothetical protein
LTTLLLPLPLPLPLSLPMLVLTVTVSSFVRRSKVAAVAIIHIS